MRVVTDVAALARSMSADTRMSTGYRFQADAVHCPTPEGLASYKAVPIRYADRVPQR